MNRQWPNQALQRTAPGVTLTVPPPAPILPPTAFARSQRAALRSR
jgi:hypothetical protein